MVAREGVADCAEVATVDVNHRRGGRLSVGYGVDEGLGKELGGRELDGDAGDVVEDVVDGEW